MPGIPGHGAPAPPPSFGAASQLGLPGAGPPSPARWHNQPLQQRIENRMRRGARLRWRQPALRSVPAEPVLSADTAAAGWVSTRLPRCHRSSNVQQVIDQGLDHLMGDGGGCDLPKRRLDKSVDSRYSPMI